MNREELKQAIENYFLENEDENVFNEMVEARMSYDGWHGDDEIFYMDELIEIMPCNNNDDLINLLNRVRYGYDGDSCIDENGNHTDPFDSDSEYFYFNGYGNLVSTDEKDYSDFMDEMIDDIIDGNVTNDEIDFPEELQEILIDYDVDITMED
jgi:hypothetical protein